MLGFTEPKGSYGSNVPFLSENQYKGIGNQYTYLHCISGNHLRQRKKKWGRGNVDLKITDQFLQNEVNFVDGKMHLRQGLKYCITTDNYLKYSVNEGIYIIFISNLHQATGEMEGESNCSIYAYIKPVI